MKVGSIVECVKSRVTGTALRFNCTVPVLGKLYTVRDIFTANYGSVCLRLEEIVNPNNPDTGREFGFSIEWFREVQFPPSLELEIKELLTIKEPQLA